MEHSDIDTELTSLQGLSRLAGRLQLVDRAVFWCFVGGLAWVPFWYGSNVLAAWGINAILFPGLVIVYEISVVLPSRRHAVALRTLALPAGLFAAVILWVLMQSAVWIPASLANPIWSTAANALGRPLAASISVNRDLTALALVKLITAASAFWLAVQLCRDAVRANRLIAAVAVIGAIYGAYGLIAVKAGQLPWLDIPVVDDRVTATFVNHNSYATYAGIGLIAAVGLLMRAYHDAIEGNWRLRLASLIDTTGSPGAALIAAAFIVLRSPLLLTGSRGGVLATGGRGLRCWGRSFSAAGGTAIAACRSRQ